MSHPLAPLLQYGDQVLAFDDLVIAGNVKDLAHIKAGGSGGYCVSQGAKTAEGLATTAATTAATIGVGAAVGNAIPIPGLGAAIGAAIGAIVAGFNALGDSLKSKFHPFPVDAAGELWALAHLSPKTFFDMHINASTNAHDHVRTIRYFRVRAGMVPHGYLGNNGKLYDPVSSWARVFAGKDCGNPYLCATDPLDPMTSEEHIQHLLDTKSAVAHEIRSAPEAKTVLRILRRYPADIFKPIHASHRQAMAKEIVALRQLAGEHGDDPVLSKALHTSVALPEQTTSSGAQDASIGLIALGAKVCNVMSHLAA